MASLKDELREYGKRVALLVAPDQAKGVVYVTPTGSSYWKNPLYAPFSGYLLTTGKLSAGNSIELTSQEIGMACQTGSGYIRGFIPVHKGHEVAVGYLASGSSDLVFAFVPPAAGK